MTRCHRRANRRRRRLRPQAPELAVRRRRHGARLPRRPSRPSPGLTETAPHLSRLLGAAFTWLGLAVGAGDVEACARLFFRESTHGLAVYDDARALLASLRYRGYRMGVVTNAIFPASLFDPKVNELGLAGYFDAFVSSAAVGGEAEPEPLPEGLELGLDPQDLFVGDWRHRYRAAPPPACAPSIERTDRARDWAGFLSSNGLLPQRLPGEGTVA
jgi:FMN phosphatase YigB (HAD superfamily)